MARAHGRLSPPGTVSPLSRLSGSLKNVRNPVWPWWGPATPPTWASSPPTSQGKGPPKKNFKDLLKTFLLKGYFTFSHSLSWPSASEESPGRTTPWFRFLPNSHSEGCNPAWQNRRTSHQLCSRRSEWTNLLLFFTCVFGLSTKTTTNICNAPLKEYAKYFFI